VYAELVCRSSFSFLEGASHPEELVAVAVQQRLSALALTDRDGLYGVVKAHLEAKAHGLKLLIGSQVTLLDAPPLVLYAQSPEGYANLCQLLSQSRLAHPKGQAGLPWRDVASRARGLCALLPYPDAAEKVQGLAEAFEGRFYVGVHRSLCAGDEARVERAKTLAQKLEAPLCVHNDVHTHARRRQPLHDVMTAIRHKTTVAACGTRLFPNAERTLKGAREMGRLFADLPEALGRTLELADSCNFSLDSLRYEFSKEELPEGHDADSYLRHRVEEGLVVRYPSGVPPDVRRQVEHELNIVRQVGYAGYFLALWDIVRFAREKGILCQGRGSAANSVVCYALQITAIDPVRMGFLFERFISTARNEPPDIDVDFEHERREEVLQYVYEKHGRARAGMVAEVICYRGRLAVREVGKALGLSLDQVDRLSQALEALGDDGLTVERLREAGLSPEDERVQRAIRLADELEGFPRHLSIHVGGFVITHGPLVELVPVENATMKGRTVVQWEKDDLNALNILKVDLLGLGMLTVLSKAFALVKAHEGIDLTLATVPAEDPGVYDMLCDADAIGVFQVESRAQMNMLPRLKPKAFYDLVIEIAIIRPGPILGDMVHPFLRRRAGTEEVTYPSPEVEAILKKTLGVPLFQEQAMKLAMVAAGFSAEEADRLRRILSHKRAEELLLPFQSRFVEGCVARGYPRQFAESCFQQFRGFSHYGFPESHSASFALIAYASAYLKRYHPAAFTAALINSQPMGFYAPHTLVEDVRRHGVEVRPVDVCASHWDCTLEDGALRLGMRLIKGFRQDSAEKLVRARGEAGFSSLSELATRARLHRHELVRLAMAGALRSLCSGRREALWEIQALGSLDASDLLLGVPLDETEVELPPLSAAEAVCTDYRALGLSLEHHPVALLRRDLNGRKAVTAAQLGRLPEGRTARVAGLVICRQRPPTAKGFCFLSLEDETGIANVVVEPRLFARYRRELLGSVFILAEGRLERAGKVVNLKVTHVEGLALRREGSRDEAPEAFRA
jgi:error-prone DNA polymerase